MTTPHIIGWGHTPFGKLDNIDVEQLIRDAATPALESAGLEARDIDGVFVGTFNAGFVPQDFSASLVAVAMPEFRDTPAVRLENACATGSAAVWAALDAVESGRCQRALVIGFEKMNTLPSAQIGEVLLKCSYVREDGDTPMGFAGVFGRIAGEYFERFGDQSDALAAIAAKNHRNGVDNPYAHMRRDLGFEFCRTPSDKNPPVAGPLKRSDCSLVSDGAAALVISKERGSAGRPAIRWRSRTQINDFLQLSKRDVTRFEGAAKAWALGLKNAGLGLDDLQFVETHDCFTIAELLQYEAMGLAPHGQGARVILDGISTRDGKLPVNRSGGLKSRGHPIGATGVSQHVMAAMQLAGQADAMQVPDARVGAVFNMGGAAVTNYLSVLEAV
ncbi:MAG: acetyl-CoA acetyltransferase [Proteobacteria bacterium]|nr:acetyl-CoA acetyltransferase [Pseudomonadota bacterium]